MKFNVIINESMKKKIIPSVLTAIIIATIAMPFYMTILNDNDLSTSEKWFWVGLVYFAQSVFTFITICSLVLCK